MLIWPGAEEGKAAVKGNWDAIIAIVAGWRLCFGDVGGGAEER